MYGNLSLNIITLTPKNIRLFIILIDSLYLGNSDLCTRIMALNLNKYILYLY